MSEIDLHIHSGFSDDGQYTPAEIMKQCRQQGIKLVAITDHNSVRGIAEAKQNADQVTLISGVELDCTCKGHDLHLLGYGIDETLGEFAKLEWDILEQERDAAEEKIRLFRRRSGVPIDLFGLLAASVDGVVTGEMIAEYVLKQKYAEKYEMLRPYLPGGAKSDMPYVRIYWDFFAKGKAAYVPIRYLALSDAVSLIHRAGGVAVLAHPGQNLNRDEALLCSILSEKVDGIEVFSSYHTGEESDYYLEIAEKHHLLVTCGSDFHGKNKPQISLGGHGAVWEDEKLAEGIVRSLGMEQWPQ